MLEKSVLLKSKNQFFNNVYVFIIMSEREEEILE